MMILMGSIDLMLGMAMKLYLILANIALVITTSMIFLNYQHSQNFMLLCLNCYADKEDNLMCYAYFNVYALYCFAS